MHIGLTPEHEALQSELRAYFEDLMTPELRAEVPGGGGEGGGPEFRKAMKKLGRDGWLGIGWPTEYGGRGLGAVEQMIFANEIQRVGFPLPFLTIDTVGPTIREFGSTELKDRFLKKILAGEVFFAIGYSEPGAGTDLASLTTRAERDGDEWVINGQKVWTSLADHADYIWLAARTDPDAPKHAGISLFLVPTTAEGYSISPIWTLGGVRTNATFYENVRVPHSALVGEVNQGWGLITSQLNRERVSLVGYGSSEALLGRVIDWAKETKLADGRRVIDQPWAQSNLARVKAGIETMKLLAWKQAWSIANGKLNPANASAVKVYGSEFMVDSYRLLLEILGQAGTLKRDSVGAQLHGQLEQRYRSASIITFGGGTNEVQRDIVAAAGLRMPRGAR